jgi:hypothetical protein
VFTFSVTLRMLENTATSRLVVQARGSHSLTVPFPRDVMSQPSTQTGGVERQTGSSPWCFRLFQIGEVEGEFICR